MLERTWALPTFEIHGIMGGFTGEGAKTVIPAKAAAKVSLRLVPGLTRDDVQAALDTDGAGPGPDVGRGRGPSAPRRRPGGGGRRPPPPSPCWTGRSRKSWGAGP